MNNPFRIKQLSFALFALLLLSSCSEDLPQHANSIPGSASTVVALRLTDLVKKAELENFASSEIYENAQDDLNNIDSDARSAIDTFVKNPLVTGIDFLSDFYVVQGTTNEPYVAMIGALVNAEKFEAYITEYGEFDVVTDMSTYKMVQEHDVVCGWTNNLMVVVVDPSGNGRGSKLDRPAVLAEIMATKKETSLTTVANFSSFLATQKDIGVFYNWENSLAGIPNYIKKDLDDELNDIVKDSYSQLIITFNNGNIHGELTNFLNETAKDKYNFTKTTGVDGDYTKLLTDDKLIAAYSANLNMEKIHEFANSRQEWKEVLDEMNEQMKLDEDDLKTLFTGEMSLAYSGNTTIQDTMDAGGYGSFDDEPMIYEREITRVLVAAGINDRAKLEEVFVRSGAPKEGELYVFDNDAYAALTDDKLLVSTDKGLITAALTGQTIDYTQQDIPSLMQNSPLSGMVNLDLSLYPSSALGVVDDMTGGKITAYGKHFSHITVQGNYTETMKIDVELTSEDHNSLYILLNGWKTLEAS